jgi:thymidylate synthase ThyX
MFRFLSLRPKENALWQIRASQLIRGYAKKKKEKSSREVPQEDVPEEFDFSHAKSKMSNAIIALSKELSKIRVGRATPGIIFSTFFTTSL